MRSSHFIAGFLFLSAVFPADTFPAPNTRTYGHLRLAFEPGGTPATFVGRHGMFEVKIGAGGNAAFRIGHSVFRLSVVGASGRARLDGEDRLAGESHYLIGSDPRYWRQNVP